MKILFCVSIIALSITTWASELENMTLSELEEQLLIADEEGNDDLAEEIITTGVANFPYKGEFAYYNFYDKYDAGNLDDAESVIEGVLNSEPDNGEWLVTKADFLSEEREDFVGAIAAYKKAVTTNYESFDIHYGLANAMLKVDGSDAKDIEVELDKAKELIETEQKYLNSYVDMTLAELRCRDGETTEAIKMLNDILAADVMFVSYIATEEAYSKLHSTKAFVEMIDAANARILHELSSIPGGSPMIDFELYDVEGNAHKWSDYQGKVVLLNIWATWCPPCRREIPDIIEIQNEYGGDDFTVLSISTDKPDALSDQELADFVSEKGINYPVLRDDGVVGQTLTEKGSGIPETYFINKEGNVVGFILGSAEKATFEAAIKPLLK